MGRYKTLMLCLDCGVKRYHTNRGMRVASRMRCPDCGSIALRESDLGHDDRIRDESAGVDTLGTGPAIVRSRGSGRAGRRR